MLFFSTDRIGVFLDAFVFLAFCFLVFLFIARIGNKTTEMLYPGYSEKRNVVFHYSASQIEASYFSIQYHTLMHLLIYLEPETLFFIMEKKQAVIVEPGSAADELSADLVDTGVPDNALFEKNEQDGVEIYVSKKVKITAEQQLEIKVKKGWLGRRLTAKITEKQTVPGFMGTRGC